MIRFSDVAFNMTEAQSLFEDGLMDIIGVDSYDTIGWDHYDSSLELYKCPPDMRLSPKALEYVFETHGFQKIYVNHTDDWETHYSENLRRGWRRKTREGGGFYISYLPEGWKEIDMTRYTIIPDPLEDNPNAAE